MNYDALLADLAALQSRVRLGGNHRYTADGKYRPGVTTVIKTMDAPALDAWKVKVQVEGTARAAYTNPPIENEPLDAYVSRLKKLGAQEYEHERLSDEAARVGVDVHSLIDHAIRTMLGLEVEIPKVCEEALFRFSGWREWAQDVEMKPLATEACVFNAEHDYCGTFDTLAIVRGDVAVIDYKPTPDLYPERRLQLAAYRKALESIGWPPLRGFINCLPRDGGDIDMIEVDPPGPELDASFDAFLHCLHLYRWQGEVGRKMRRAKVA